MTSNLKEFHVILMAVTTIAIVLCITDSRKPAPIQSVEPVPIHIHIQRDIKPEPDPDLQTSPAVAPEIKGRFHDKTSDKVAETPTAKPLLQNAFNDKPTSPPIPKDDTEIADWEGIIVTASWCKPCAIWKTAESDGQKEIVKENDIQVFSDGFDSFTVPEYKTNEPQKFYVLTKPELRKYRKKRIYIVDYDKFKADLAMFNIQSVPTYIRFPASNPALERGEVLSAPVQPKDVIYYFNTGKPPRGKALQRTLKAYSPWLFQ